MRKCNMHFRCTEAAMYAEVKPRGRQHRALSHLHPGSAATKTSAATDDGDDNVGPELPPKLDIAKLPNADQQPAVIITCQ